MIYGELLINPIKIGKICFQIFIFFFSFKTNSTTLLIFVYIFSLFDQYYPYMTTNNKSKIPSSTSYKAMLSLSHFLANYKYCFKTSFIFFSKNAWVFESENLNFPRLSVDLALTIFKLKLTNGDTICII